MIEKIKRTYPDRRRRNTPAEKMELEAHHFDVLRILVRHRYLNPTGLLQLLPNSVQRMNPNTLQRKGDRAMTPETLATWEEAEKKVRDSGRQRGSSYFQLAKAPHMRTLQKWLQYMYKNGYVSRRSRLRGGWLYSLGSEGALALEQLGELKYMRADYNRFNREVSGEHVEHTMLVSRVRAALTLATPTDEAMYDDDKHWHPESRDLKADVYVEGLDRLVVVRPDAFFRIQTPGGFLSFLLEAVRNNSEPKRFLPKLKAYTRSQSEFQDSLKISGFRVVILTTSEIRRDNIVRMIQKEFEYDNLGWLLLVGAELNANPHARVAQPERCFSVGRPESILSPIWLCGRSDCNQWHSLVE